MALLQWENTSRFLIWDARQTLALVTVCSRILFSSHLHFCCSGTRQLIIEINACSHSNSPEIGTRIVTMGLGLLLLLLFPNCHILALSWLSVSILSLAPGTELSQLFYLLSSSVIFQLVTPRPHPLFIWISAAG